jgi:serine/threonine protein kinase
MAVCLSEDLVERYVSGDCSSEERRTVEIHSVECDKCRDQIERTRSDYTPYAADPSRTVAIPVNDTITLREETRIEQDEVSGGPASAVTKRSADEGSGIPTSTRPGPSRTEDTAGSGFGPRLEGYKILGEVGSGGGGTVWRALQVSTRREVALKVLSTRILGSERARLRFQREVELTARLEHPNIARIYDSGLDRGVYYYTMELFQGQHLEKFIKYSQMSVRQTLELMYAVCQAVQYAHQRGIIHRDLKPSNIIVTADGEPHVLDFGLAKGLLDDDKGVTVSIDGQVTGTPAYMSPEQAAGHLDAIDTRTDVYSLGAILYHILTGKWPCDLSGSYYQVLKSIQEQEPARPSTIVSHLDGDIESILLKALAKDPDERYQSASELAHDIRCWLDGLPIIARSVDTVYLLRKFISRHRAASVIAALLLVIILSTSFISAYSYSKERDARRIVELQKEMFKREAGINLVYANQVLFILFLELWHDEKLPRAQGAVAHFPQQSVERAGAVFLLDPRPLEEKKEQLLGRLMAEQPSFGQFLIGEYHFKNNNKPAAIEAYNRCLETGQGASEYDDWFRNRATRKLNELLGRELPPLSCPIVGGG